MDSKISVTSPCLWWGFFVIITVERKKIRPMKLLAKIALGILAYNTVRTPRKESLIVGTRTNMEKRGIPNNGGL